MFGANAASDKALLKAVSQRLNHGGSGSQARVHAAVQAGNVTLTGMLQYDAQRSPLVKSVARISGVRRVIDQLRLLPKAVYATGPTPRAAAPAPILAPEAVVAPVESPAEPTVESAS